MPVRRIEFAKYAVSFGKQIRRLDCETQYAVLVRRFDTSYLTGGYGVSDLSGVPSCDEYACYALENQLLSVSLLICLGKHDYVERISSGSITTWEDLTTHFLAQFFSPGRTAKLHNDILMFQQHHEESLSEAWTHFKDLLQKIAIEKLAEYEDEGWNNPVNPEDGDLNYENPDIKQLLGIMEHKVDALMNNALSEMGKSQGMFEMTRNEMYRQLPEPSR
ncbi:zinc finger, CCHC-type containing protein [Tanacetum coccineum]